MMASKLAWLAMAFAMAAVVVTAQNSPQDYVELHNEARREVSVGPVSWDDTLAAYAQSWADQRVSDCALEHSQGPYGENIWRGGAGGDWSASNAVADWVAEKQYYDHGSNSCSSPLGPLGCGHYTQVVWSDTTAIGCGRVVCNSGDVFVVCSYNPRGNWEGQSPYP
ncbi:hypothetical protein ACP70R_022639 [Stipagrostis hirtigluma subsp. patula]